MIGAFWQPRGVLIDTAVLATLPEREYRAGLAEVVKYGVILDEEFFRYLEANVAGLRARQDDVLRHVVARSCQLKANVVSADEREETGLRAVLNYGHTFCHAFETLTGYGHLLHGEAVAIGMTCAARLAERMSRVEGNFVQRQFDLLDQLGLPTQTPQLDAAEVLAVMARDKKRPAASCASSCRRGWGTSSWSAGCRSKMSAPCSSPSDDAPHRAARRATTDRFCGPTWLFRDALCMRSAYFFTASIVRIFSLSKDLVIRRRSGRRIPGIVKSRSNQRLTSVLCPSHSKE